MTMEMAQAFERFREYYARVVPPPQKPSLREGMPLRTWFLILAALAGVLAVSLRTAHAFYRAAQASGLGQGLAVLEAFFAMLFVEGGLATLGYVRSWNQATKNDEADLGSGFRYWLVVGLFLSISAIAGVVQALGMTQDLAQGLAPVVEWMLVLTQGVGGSLAVFGMSEVAGADAAAVLIRNRQALERWKAEMRAWEMGLKKAWERTEAYQALKEQAFSGRSQGRSREQREQDRLSRPAVVRLAERLRQDYGSPDALPGVREIARRYGVSTSTASYAVRRFAMSQNGEGPEK